MTVLLVRHAAHPLVGRVLCGRMSGVHLDEVGQAQAGRLACALASRRPAAIHSSPLPRCLETADAIATACDLIVQPCAALTEIDFGAWTGKAFAALAGDQEWERWNVARSKACPPSGESMQAAQDRVGAWLRRLPAEAPDTTVVAVSHADVIKAALMAWLGLPLEAHDRFDIDPASVSTLLLWEGGGKVARLNEEVA